MLFYTGFSKPDVTQCCKSMLYKPTLCFFSNWVCFTLFWLSLSATLISSKPLFPKPSSNLATPNLICATSNPWAISLFQILTLTTFILYLISVSISLRWRFWQLSLTIASFLTPHSQLTRPHNSTNVEDSTETRRNSSICTFEPYAS